MKCGLCGKRIGLIRRLRDREYCSEEHRKRAMRTSARALRATLDWYGFENSWLHADAVISGNKSLSPTPPFAQALLAIIIGIAIPLVLLILPSGADPTPARSSTNTPSNPTKWLAKSIQQLLSIRPPQTLTHDFSNGMDGWTTVATGPSADWSNKRKVFQPQSLRIWTPSQKLTDYEVVFDASIERRAMSWAFRATDFQNYYASKIIAGRTGQAGRAEIVRIAMIRGKEAPRQRLPLPVNVEAHVDYQLRVTVRGGDYRTYLNGQLIDRWQDSRLSAGGIGFFSEQGESSIVRRVSVVERKAPYGGLFSLYILPLDAFVP